MGSSCTLKVWAVWALCAHAPYSPYTYDVGSLRLSGTLVGVFVGAHMAAPNLLSRDASRFHHCGNRSKHRKTAAAQDLVVWWHLCGRHVRLQSTQNIRRHASKVTQGEEGEGNPAAPEDPF
jgi:hypothetical protein